MCVCVCVCVRERDSVCVRVSECVCVFVCPQRQVQAHTSDSFVQTMAIMFMVKIGVMGSIKVWARDAVPWMQAPTSDSFG